MKTHPHVVLVNNIPVIEGSKVPVHRVYSWRRQGTPIDTIIRRYPQLGPAKIFDALAFAYDNLEFVTQKLIEERMSISKDDNPY